MPAAPGTESRVIRLSEGVYAQVVERAPTSPLPRRLDTLLANLRATRRAFVTVLGTRQACTDAEHSWQPWLSGVYASLELRLALCAFCGVVEVRDVGLDILPGLAAGRSGPRRRSDVLGWYSGKRSDGRQYL